MNEDIAMLKAAFAAALLAISLASAAAAAEPPKSPEDCFKAAVALAEQAEQKKLAEDKQLKVEDLLKKVEGYCDASQFPEAAAALAEIETTLGGS